MKLLLSAVICIAVVWTMLWALTLKNITYSGGCYATAFIVASYLLVVIWKPK